MNHHSPSKRSPSPSLARRGSPRRPLNVRSSAIQLARQLIERRPLYLHSVSTSISLRGEAIELAVIDCHGLPLLNTRIRPKHPIPPQVRSIRGITNAGLAGCPGWETLWPALVRLLYGRVVASYHGADDLRLLRQSAQAAGISAADLPDWNFDSITDLFAQYYGEWDERWWCYMNQPLSHAAIHLGIQQGQARSALGDAETARRVLLAMAETDESG